MDIGRWNDIFKLLAMVIIADKRVYKEEVDEFVNSAMEIKSAINDATLITRDMAFEWFRGNRDDILTLSKSPDFSVSALKIIMSLNEFEHRKAVLSAMVAVSMADSEFHPSEESLIVIAAAHWKLKLTELTNVRTAKRS